MQLVKQKINFTILDALRGLAALYVCIAHSRGIFWMGMTEYLKVHPFKSWMIYDYFLALIMASTKLSSEFVIFFFVLSGFSIAHSLVSRNIYTDFLKKRFLRLYPTYLVGLFWAGIVLIIAMKYRSVFFDGRYNYLNVLFEKFQNSKTFFNTNQILNNLFYNPDINSIIGPYWSLVYEVIFYLLAPLFILRLGLYGIISSILFIVGFFIKSDSIFYNYFFNYNFYFFIGMYCYKYLPVIKRYAALLGNKVVVFITLITLLLMIGIESVFPLNKLSLLVSACLSVFLIANTLQKNVRIMWLEKIGGFSYTLYATHFQTMMLFFVLFDMFGIITLQLLNPFIWLLPIPIAVFIAYIFYIMTEKPIKNYLSSLRFRNLS